MSRFLISIFSLLALAYFAFSKQRTEDALARLSLKNKVSFSIGKLNDVADFKKLADIDERKFDSDLAQFKMIRISHVFISDDGKYVITFAKDTENKIKRIIFVYHGKNSYNIADDVIDVKNIEVKTSQGSISVAEGLLLSN
jgi:hypothetical protein